MANDLTPHSTTSPLALLSSRSRQEISAALAQPCDQEKLARALRDLLGLYWIAADSPEERARQIALFVKDLAKFPEAVLAYAIHEWRTREDRRPSIASLHQLCMSRQHDLMARRDELFEAERIAAQPEPEPLSPEEAERRRENLERIMRATGFLRRPRGWITETEAAEEDAKQAERPPHWSETAAPDDPRWTALRKARAAAGVALPEPGRVR